MQLHFQPPKRRDTREYRAFRASVRAERPVCEHCNSAPSAVIAHIVQPLLGGSLMDKSNVLALCVRCDAAFTRLHPPLRRRPQPRS